ncbi:MAG: cell division protein FtsZ [Lachnospiraceae bacterium]|nr:cell division protein FtsZ [Lachnospiraceae bacterium]
MIEVNDEEASVVVRIKVVGVGGAGNNAVNRMISEGIAGVEYYAVNTDRQALMNTKARPVQIGEKTTQGFGAGADPEKGREAAEESVDELTECLKDADMVFITCGMGGGTGTGAAPVVARVAREIGCHLVVAVVTKPFSYEGDIRMQNALNGIEILKQNVDTLVVIPNDKISEMADRRMTKKEGFRKGDEILQQIVQSITELINNVLDVNIDFADVKSVMCNAGIAHVGVGFGQGDDKALDAVKMAVDNQLLETNIDNAKAVLLNISAGNYTMYDEQCISEYIVSLTGRGVNLIIGCNEEENEDMRDSLKVVLVATGIDEPMSHGSSRMMDPSRYRQGRPSLGGYHGQQAGGQQQPFPQQQYQQPAAPQFGGQPEGTMGAGRTVRPLPLGGGQVARPIQGQQPMQGTGPIPQQGQGAPQPVRQIGPGTNNIPRVNGLSNSRPARRQEQYVIPNFIKSSSRDRKGEDEE